MYKNKLKILRVVSDLYPEVLGGLSIHASRMSKLQSEMGHNITVLTSDHGDREKPRREERDGYEIIRHHELFSPLGNSITPSLLRSLVREFEKHDIVHSHSHLFFTSNLASLMSKFSSTPLVMTNHGTTSQTAPDLIQKAYFPLMARPTINAADRVFCYTEDEKRELVERGVKSDISVIHNGIHMDEFSPSSEINEQKQILFVGRITPGKGVGYLIRAFSEIHNEYPDYTLKIVGSGGKLNDIKNLSKSLGVSEFVEFTGEISNENMDRLYNESAFFVLPSMSEGLPRTVLESLACGTPVITSNLPQLEELVSDVGITVERGSVPGLASAMEELIENEDLRNQMGSNGRKKIQEKYSWRDTVERTTKEYREVI